MLNTFPLFGLSWTPLPNAYIIWSPHTHTTANKMEGKGLCRNKKILYVCKCTQSSQFLSLFCLPKYQVIYNGYAHHMAVTCQHNLSLWSKWEEPVILFGLQLEHKLIISYLDSSTTNSIKLTVQNFLWCAQSVKV
jgi:hypothetical protein